MSKCQIVGNLLPRLKFNYLSNYLHGFLLSRGGLGVEDLHGDVESRERFVEDMEVDDMDEGESCAELSSVSSSESFLSVVFVVVGVMFLKHQFDVCTYTKYINICIFQKLNYIKHGL